MATEPSIQSVSAPVSLATEQLIQSVSAALESEIIEENKTPTIKTSKAIKSHNQSREKRKSESEAEFIKRIKQLDDAIIRRANYRNTAAVLSKMLEADFDKRLKNLNNDSKTSASVSETPVKSTKL